MLLLDLGSTVLDVISSSLIRQGSPVHKAGDLDALVGYASTKLTLSNATRVPLHLPTFIPFAGDAQHPVFAILQGQASGSYAIQLAWAADCTGGNWCHLGSIEGSDVPIPVEGRKVPVSLRNGIKGYFVRSRCCASCTEATLLWSQGGYYYAVGIKAGDQKILIKMADSAIELHPSHGH